METKVMEMPNAELQDIEDAVVIEDTKKEESPKPYIVVRRLMPGQENEEGILLPLPEDGSISPDMLRSFMRDMYVTKLADKRTIVLNVRLANNFILTESYSSPSIAEFDENVALEICQAKIRNRLWELLLFLHASATFSEAKLEAEYDEMQEQNIPVVEQ